MVAVSGGVQLTALDNNKRFSRCEREGRGGEGGQGRERASEVRHQRRGACLFAGASRGLFAGTAK